MSILDSLYSITSSDSSMSSSCSSTTELEKSTDGIAKIIIKDLSLERSLDGVDEREWAIIEEEGVDSDDEFDPYLEGVDRVRVDGVAFSRKQFLSLPTELLKNIAFIKNTMAGCSPLEVKGFVARFLSASKFQKRELIKQLEDVAFVKEALKDEPKPQAERFLKMFLLSPGFRKADLILQLKENIHKKGLYLKGLQNAKDLVEQKKEDAALVKKLLPKVSRIAAFLKADIADGEIKSLNEFFGEKGLIMDMTTGEPQF